MTQLFDNPTNTAEQAMNLLARSAGASVKGDAVQIRRRTMPTKYLSDGIRVYFVTLCDRHRWIEVHAGFDRIGQFDQRDFWDAPGQLCKAVLDAIPDAIDYTPTERTDAGLQHVTPCVAPIAHVDRLTVRQRGRMKPTRTQRAPDHGLFDLNARNQTEMF